MPKILSPSFPRRRPSGVVRYVLVAIVLLIMIYLYKSPDNSLPRPIAGAGPIPRPRPRPYDGDSGGRHHPEAPPTYGPNDDNTPSKPDPEKPYIKPNKGPALPPLKEDEDDYDTGSTIDSGSPISTGPDDAHPIDRLIYDAELSFAELASKETGTLSDAAQAYRKRRGRHPPPGFDRWFEFAQNNSAIIVEDFFDQIYHDLQPFWGLAPAVLRKESWDFEMTIHVRDGEATSTSDWFWTVIWLDLIKTIQHLLPDMDLPLNAMDEPRHVVPWEEMDKYMKKAAKTVNLPKAKNVRSDFQKLPEPGKGDLKTETRDRAWDEQTSTFIRPSVVFKKCHSANLETQ